MNRDPRDGFLATFVKRSLETFASSISWRVFDTLKEAASRNVFTSVEITDEEINSWLIRWLAAHEYTETCTKLQARLLDIDRINHPSEDIDVPAEDSEWEDQRLVFTPGHGNHFLKYDGVWLWFRKSKRDGENGGDGNVFISYYDGSRTENIEIIVFGKSADPLRKLVKEAKAYYYRNRAGKIGIWKTGQYGGWNEAGLQKVRDIDSIYLQENIAANIIEDIERFLSREQWYEDRGIPWRRGYLFYGPPGNGKTSFTKGLASHFGMNLYVMNFASTLDDNKLVDLFNNVRRGSIILIEDIDKLFGKEQSKVAGVKYSGLTNAIDGVESNDGRILVMTTNYENRLESSLIRPGRIDLRQLFDMANRSQIHRMFRRFYGDLVDDKTAAEFLNGFEDGDFSMAALQSYLLRFIDEPEKAIESKEDIKSMDVNGENSESGKEESNEEREVK